MRGGRGREDDAVEVVRRPGRAAACEACSAPQRDGLVALDDDEGTRPSFTWEEGASAALDELPPPVVVVAAADPKLPAVPPRPRRSRRPVLAAFSRSPTLAMSCAACSGPGEDPRAVAREGGADREARLGRRRWAGRGERGEEVGAEDRGRRRTREGRVRVEVGSGWVEVRGEDAGRVRGLVQLDRFEGRGECWWWCCGALLLPGEPLEAPEDGGGPDDDDEDARRRDDARSEREACRDHARARWCSRAVPGGAGRTRRRREVTTRRRSEPS